MQAVHHVVRAWVAVLVAVVSLVAAGCGSDGPAKPQRVVVAQTGPPDSLDPALSYSGNGWQALWLVYTPLLTYRHAEGAEGTRLMPGLAESLPRISEDGRVYRLRLRAGLRYSDGRPVRAGDVAHALERVLKLASPGSWFYLPIAGAERFAAGKATRIAGISADDRTRRIAFRLTRPDSSFANALALPFAAPVPADTAMSALPTDPPPGVGPYRFGSVHPRTGFTLVRNDRFAGLPGIPPAGPAQVEVRAYRDPLREAQDVMRGRADSMLDPPPGEILRQVRGTDRLRTGPGSRTLYVWLDTKVPPFDDPRLRRAAALAIDPAALARVYGPTVRASCNILPPAAPGYRPLRPCPQRGSDMTANRAQARRLVRVASRRTGGRAPAVSIWSPNERPDSVAGDYVADALASVGFRARPRHVAFAVFAQTVGRRSTGAQAGVLGLQEDFPHPASLLRYFSGRELQAEGNLNLSEVDDPALTARIERLRATPLSRTLADWAAVDRTVVERRYAVPFATSPATLFVSDRIGCAKLHPVYGPDLSSFCVRG